MSRSALVFSVIVLGIIALIFCWPAQSAEPIMQRTTDRNVEVCGQDNAAVNGCFIIADGVCQMHIAPFGASWAPGHEADHCNGMRHGAWVSINGRSCAPITEQGKTHWQPGMMMCVSDYRLVMVKP